jgi:hypothetical protein
MSEVFDFGALVARATTDNPDAAVFNSIDALADAKQIARQTWRGRGRHKEACVAMEAAMADLADARPETLEGLLAKLRWAAESMYRAPIFEAQHSALMDAIAWLEPPKPGRRAKVVKVG